MENHRPKQCPTPACEILFSNLSYLRMERKVEKSLSLCGKAGKYLKLGLKGLIMNNADRK